MLRYKHDSVVQSRLLLIVVAFMVILFSVALFADEVARKRNQNHLEGVKRYAQGPQTTFQIEQNGLR